MAFLLLPLAAIFLSVIPTSAQVHQYTVVNKCPTSINLYIAGNLDTNLATGASVTRSLGIDAGFFYTDANGGSTTGAATRAGFYDDNNSYIYYLVRDSSHFNTGMSITPNHVPTGGFCPVAICEGATCLTAFSQPPTRFPPPVCGTPPTPPVYSCPYANLSYTITFCPSGSFPSVGQAIHPNFNTNKCMDVRGANYANGTPVQIYDCNGTGAQKWVINRGSTKVKLAGTNFCLDAGSGSPGNGVGMKIWQCYDNLAAQQWFYTDDNRIMLNGKAQCVDLPSGLLTNGNQLQTWQCIAGNSNQVWTL